MSGTSSDRHYLPAAGHDFFLPLYDIVAKILGVDRARRTLLDHAPLKPGDRALEIGCGTGSFLMMLKRRFPEVEFTGLDPDPKALARAKKKAERAGFATNMNAGSVNTQGVPHSFPSAREERVGESNARIHLDQGFADSLPYPSASFDAVFSSFMFHHLEADDREKTLREVRRVLKSGASLYLLDLEVSGSSHGFCLFHSRELLRDNTTERILALMRAAGFPNPKKMAASRLISGHAACYQASA